MNKDLLIIGAGIYGLVAKEIAESMGCFERIAFVDDAVKDPPKGIDVIGTTAEIEKLAIDYPNIVVAIGNPKARLELIERAEALDNCMVVSLISPYAYVSPSAKLGDGCIIEPMAVVHTGCELSRGCIISAGAVVNHCSVLCDGVHIDCNATVPGNMLVSKGTKVCSGDVFQGEKLGTEITCL